MQWVYLWKTFNTFHFSGQSNIDGHDFGSVQFAVQQICSSDKISDLFHKMQQRPPFIPSGVEFFIPLIALTGRRKDELIGLGEK